jgi:hypothetical protein
MICGKGLNAKMKRMIFIIIVGTVLCGVPALLLAELVRITAPDEELSEFWQLAFPEEKHGIFIENSFGDPATPEEWLLDLNDDGVNDFRIGAYGGTTGFDVQCLGNNAVWVEPKAPESGDINRHIIPLQVDDIVAETISRDAYYGGAWQHTQYADISGYIGSGFEGIPYLTSGYFAEGVTGYAGLRFEIGTNTHYGYVLIDEEPSLWGGGFIVEYGYESEPDTAFTIIPEPGSVAMWLGGAGLLTLYRRERARCRKHPDDMRQRIKR